MGQCDDSGIVRGGWAEAMGHVVILLFHPPNLPTLIHLPTIPPLPTDPCHGLSSEPCELSQLVPCSENILREISETQPLQSHRDSLVSPRVTTTDLVMYV